LGRRMPGRKRRAQATRNKATQGPMPREKKNLILRLKKRRNHGWGCKKTHTDRWGGKLFANSAHRRKKIDLW